MKNTNNILVLSYIPSHKIITIYETLLNLKQEKSCEFYDGDLLFQRFKK